MIIEYGVAETDQDMEQILELQCANRPENLSQKELEQNGFVSVKHDVDLLRKMAQPFPHVVAKLLSPNNKKGGNDDNDTSSVIIGYALSLMRDFDASYIPCLQDINHVLDSVKDLSGQPLKARNYTIMGQVCIHKDYREKGIFGGLYETIKQQMSNHFDCLVTSISKRNPRSLKAHTKVGFQIIHEYTTTSCGFGSGGSTGGCKTNESEKEEWCIVIWDWKNT